MSDLPPSDFPAQTASGPQTASGSKTAAAPKTVGILVIHGMGEENPYGPLDQFARGFLDELRDRKQHYRIGAEWKERRSSQTSAQGSWVQAQLRLQPLNDEGEAQAPTTARPEYLLAEYYWSPMTKGKAGDIDVLLYLIRSGTSPFRYIAENWNQISRAAHAGSGRQKLVLIVKEIFRLLLIFPLLIGSFVAIAAALAQLGTQASSLAKLLTQGYHSWWLPIVAVIRLLLLGSLFGYLAGRFSAYRRQRKAPPPTETARKAGRVDAHPLQVAGAVALFVILLLLPFAPDLARPLQAIHGCVTSCARQPGGANEWALCRYFIGHFLGRLIFSDGGFAPLVGPTLLLGFAAIIRWFLINFLGDVVVYTNLNQRASSFPVRSQVIAGCEDALGYLYADLVADSPVEKDFAIVIASHSLGTVVAYDVLNECFNRARLEKSLSLDLALHIRGLFTFGSPLNKIYYFFRDISAPHAVIRSQVVDSLHSLRLLQLCEPGGYPIAPVTTPDPVTEAMRNLLWINAWSLMDPISGRLFFYDLGSQRSFWYWRPIWAHVLYWEDRRVYAYFYDDLIARIGS